MAQLARGGGREQDMADFIIDMIRVKDDQTVRLEVGERPVPADYSKKERDVIYYGFKALISHLRVQLKTIDAIQENPKYTRYDKKITVLREKIAK